MIIVLPTGGSPVGVRVRKDRRVSAKKETTSVAVKAEATTIIAEEEARLSVMIAVAGRIISRARIVIRTAIRIVTRIRGRTEVRDLPVNSNQAASVLRNVTADRNALVAELAAIRKHPTPSENTGNGFLL